MTRFFKLLSVSLILVLCNSNVFADKIRKIEIVGNNRVERPTIIEYSGVSRGQEFNSDSKNNITKSLYDTHLFKNINVQFSAGILKINVTEMPFISSILFDGNYKIKTKDLADAIYTAPGETLNEWKIKQDIAKIREMYHLYGRSSIKIKEEIKQLENGRVKVIFKIDEGPKTGIHKILFVGNKHYKNSELKTIIATKEARWFRFLESNDTYNPDRLELDKYRLKQFYNSVGYADFRIISTIADMLPTKSGYTLTFSIEEGLKYKFGKTTLQNKLAAIPNKEIWKFIEDKEGELFNLNKVEKMADRITHHLASQGYPDVNVIPDITPDRNNGIANIKLIVEPAAKIFVNQINIEGNLKTEDHVIRREMKIAEGDIFNRDLLEKSERNIRNLDYFDHRMAMNVTPTSVDDRYDVNLKVKEKSTASLGLQTGYNTSGGIFGKINFLERNFVGTGRYLNAGVQVGRNNLSLTAGITDPNFMDKNFSLGQSFFYNSNAKGSGFVDGGKKKYSQVSYGGTTTLGYQIAEDLYHSIDYTLKEEVLKGDAELKKQSIHMAQQFGKFVTSSIGHTVTYDKTDSRVNTKNGYIISSSQEYAGVGGHVKHLKHEIEGKAYKSTEDNKYTLKLSASAGHIMGMHKKEVRINNRFNLGDYSLRGFAPGGIGPRTNNSNEEGLGGDKYYAFSAELDFPLGLPEEFDITGSVFFDAGSVWDGGYKKLPLNSYHRDRMLRTSAGFGFTWITKIAPIRVDWGFPIHKKKYDETQDFHIRFSTSL